jgi:hypothetical protein
LTTSNTITVRRSRDLSESEYTNYCLKGDSVPEPMTDEFSRLRVSTANGPAYYSTSAGSVAVSGATNELQDIPVYSYEYGTEERKIITSFLELDETDPSESTYNTLNSYAIVEKNEVFLKDTPNPPVVSMTTVGSESPSYVISADADLERVQASIDVILDNKIYLWQEVFASGSYDTYSNWVREQELLSDWSLNAIYKTSAATGAWNLYQRSPVQGSDLLIEQPTDLADMSGSSIYASGKSIYLDTASFNPNNWKLQRTHVRTETISGNEAIQTIYSAVDNEQVLMESSTETLTVNPVNPLEVGIALMSQSADIEDADIQYFAKLNFNVALLADADTPIDSHGYDVNGVIVAHSDDVASTRAAMQKSSAIVINHSN